MPEISVSIQIDTCILPSFGDVRDNTQVEEKRTCSASTLADPKSLHNEIQLLGVA
jgi:hypothetical protein